MFQNLFRRKVWFFSNFSPHKKVWCLVNKFIKCWESKGGGGDKKFRMNCCSPFLCHSFRPFLENFSIIPPQTIRIIAGTSYINETNSVKYIFKTKKWSIWRWPFALSIHIFSFYLHKSSFTFCSFVNSAKFVWNYV